MKTYGYAGQWCHCAKPKRPEGGLVSVTTTTFGTIPKISPTTPDRSVEESRYILAQEWLHSTDQTTQAMVAMLVERANAITKEQTLTAERQKREEAVEAERERIVAILKASYLVTNGYKDTDTVRTAMYIENEGFNIAINKRLDFFIEQITQPNNPNV